MPTTTSSIFVSIVKYDRSGRSEGIAIISYETPAEAKKALGHYNGKLCKGALFRCLPAKTVLTHWGIQDSQCRLNLTLALRRGHVVPVLPR